MTPFLGDVVNGDDIRMAQTGGGLGLGSETLQEFELWVRSSQNHFYGDNTIETALARAVHDAHSAARNLLEDFVISQSGAGAELDCGMRRGGLVRRALGQRRREHRSQPCLPHATVA